MKQSDWSKTKNSLGTRLLKVKVTNLHLFMSNKETRFAKYSLKIYNELLLLCNIYSSADV